MLRTEIGRSHCFLANSATALIYLALKAFSEFSGRREVILPAYTAPSLVLPIQKAGLVPRLCDISLETFLLDIDQLPDCLTNQTLAILAVHSYGIPLAMREILKLARQNGSYVIEDAAVAHGSRLYGKPVGAYGDVSVISLNRGKNMTTFTGGIALTDNAQLSLAIARAIAELPRASLRLRLKIALNLMALGVVVRPWIYTLARPLLLKYRSLSLYTNFESFQYTRFQAGIGYALLKKRQGIFARRMENGQYLREALGDISRIRLPAIPNDAEPAFNQFPILVETAELRNRLLERIIDDARVEATVLYPKAVHHCYNLGIPKALYPNANDFASRVLLLPTHPFINPKRLEKVVEVIRKFLP
ncbi:MAG: DegT/DnrJ/EryC1/StrS family aminotransferase [Candidatus Poribacteria bacterium]|nr:DegT/DnrJ/EryC1/StrS family aminotransferase [Candidatus Poribacteria bacterium]